MRNKSVTRRRREIRTGRIKTHQSQSKRCKKISPQIGGGRWYCECRVNEGDKGNEVGDQKEGVVNVKQRRQDVEVGVGEGEEEEYDETGKYQILEGGNTYLSPHEHLSVTEEKYIIIDNKIGGRILPRNLENGDIITEIKRDGNSEAIPVANIQKIQEFIRLLNTIGSDTVILTISRKHKGGTASSKPRYVKVNVVLPPSGVNPNPRRNRGAAAPAAQDDETAMMKRLERRLDENRRRDANVGGKKTTYRRKKHVTRRKINTKRRKVMVGGVIPDSTGWNSLGLDGKFNAIEAVSSIEELETIWDYIKYTNPNDEGFKELRNKVVVRKQELKSNLKKKTVICKCSKTERNKVNDTKKETPKD
jgi:hypothetical protein